nr:uncharacterized protein CTRU02_06168 [Colletotrichum truncatum]KAF6793296.1 hypothetical protein CTRU02_06168 [Colletotrichum truncatum]
MVRFLLPLFQLLSAVLFFQVVHAGEYTCAPAPLSEESFPLLTSYTWLERQPNGVYYADLQVGAAKGQPPRAKVFYAPPGISNKKGVLRFENHANFRMLMCVSQDEHGGAHRQCFWLNAGDNCTTNHIAYSLYFIAGPKL